MKTNGNATSLLAILREGWADGQRNRKLLPSLQPTLSALLTECLRRYGHNKPARMAYMDGHAAGMEGDSYAMDIAKIAIIDGDYTVTP